MSLRRTLPLVVLLAWAGAPLAAQEEQEYASPEMAEMMAAYEKAGMVTEHHKALEKMAGAWELTVKMWMDPNAEPTISYATSEAEMIFGGRFLADKVTGEFMGQEFNGYGLTGYNNVSGEYEAMWVDNFSTGIYRYTGAFNETGDEFISKGKMLDPVTGESIPTWSVVRFEGDGMVVESWEERGGEERKTMELIYKPKM
jgi:hypothetical protein